ncbi:MAG: hypothetical protein AB1531_05580 [Chloroflexota bacterium]
MNKKRNPVGWGCFLAWLIATLLAVAAGFAVFFVSMAVLGESMRVIPDIAASLILTVCFGIVVGLAQWAILRRYVQRSAWWMGVTLLGFLISSPALISLSGGFGPYIGLLPSLGMSAALGMALGITQWLVIRRKVSRSAFWIAISLVSWILAGLIGIALAALSSQMGPVLYWLGLFFAGIVLSVVGMMWLLKQTNPTEEARTAGQ